MLNFMRTYSTEIVTLAVAAAAVCVAMSGPALGRKHPTAFELLDRYAQVQDQFRSFVVKGTSSADIRGSFSAPEGKAQSGRKRKYVVYELRFDGRRFNWRRSMWGNIRFPREFIPKNKSLIM